MKIKASINLILVSNIIFFLTSCSPKVFGYKRVEISKSQIQSNILYSNSMDADLKKNRLDLFIPLEKKWPIMIFVHGGNWSEGDKDLEMAGEDIYGNIGRFFAREGIGVAVISYRLMPKVDWKTQILDVARAVAWVKKNISKYGGDPKAIFLSGHSAGAQLVTRVALDPTPLKHFGFSLQTITGVISISGAGFDLTDEETYEFAKKEKVFEKIFFSQSISPALRRKLSPLRYVNKNAPPFLIIDAERDPDEIKNESKKLHEALDKVGVFNQFIEIPKTGHKPIILEMSNPEKMLSRIIEVFIQSFYFKKKT